MYFLKMTLALTNVVALVKCKENMVIYLPELIS